MKVSLVVPLVSLPLFAACSPVVHNADLLKNVNQEKDVVRSFSAEKNSEEPESEEPETLTQKKVFVPPQSAGGTETFF